jgi:hypothetical protein
MDGRSGGLSFPSLRRHDPDQVLKGYRAAVETAQRNLSPLPGTPWNGFMLTPIPHECQEMSPLRKFWQYPAKLVLALLRP